MVERKEQTVAARPGARLRVSIADGLRLEVALAGPNHEVYSWVGVERLDDRGLDQMLGEDVFTAGSIAWFPALIADADPVLFPYCGETRVGGRRLRQFASRVSVEKP